MTTHSPRERQLLASALGVAAPIGEADRPELDATLDRVLDHAERCTMARGEVLFRQGEHGDSLYVLLNGRLHVYGSEDEPPINLLGPSDCVGEMALLDDAPRSATVVAARASRLLRLSRESFEQLSDGDLVFAQGVIRNLAARVRRAIQENGSPQDRLRSIAVIGLDDHSGFLIEQLGETLETYGDVELLTERTASSHLGGPLEDGLGAVEGWLDEMEQRCDHLLLACEARPSPWQRLCLERADLVVFVASASSPPALRAVERQLLDARSMVHPRTALLLHHPPGTVRPSGTSIWLAPRAVDSHHHVRTGCAPDLHRAARLLTGRGVGLVLSGGAALGAAHMGLLAFLMEQGVPLDYLGGTSAGAGISAAAALHADYESIHDAIVESFVDRSPFTRPTLPVMSLFSKASMDRTAQDIYGDVDIEDLWIPWFGVSADIVRGRTFVHSRGPLWRGVRASCAIPVVTPPVLQDGAVLVDGGVLDNFPVATMQRLCGGVVLGSNVQADGQERHLQLRYDDLPRGRELLLERLRGRRRALPLPDLRYVLLRLATLGNRATSAEQRAACAFLLEPDLDDFEVSMFQEFTAIARRGYEEAAARLDPPRISNLIPGWKRGVPASHQPPESEAGPAFDRLGETRSRRASAPPPPVAAAAPEHRALLRFADGPRRRG